MITDVNELVIPRILAVGDQQHLQAALRLKVVESCEVVPCSDPAAALAHIRQEPFDLCLVDLQLPGTNGIEFVEAARQIDPGLGFVILSGCGTEVGLRRAIPPQVYDFVFKPVPGRAEFEGNLPDWIQRTRSRRRELVLVKDSDSLARELGMARIERDIELTASESARDALLQSANLLTTIQALLVSATHSLDSKRDASLGPLHRTLQEARRATEAATSITEGFFNTAYANRDNSPAALSGCLNHAIGICTRWVRAEQEQKGVDVAGSEQNAVVNGLSGIELLLLLIPALGAALELTAPGTTVQVRAEGLSQLDAAPRGLRARGFLWVNRKHAKHSQAGILLSIRASAHALDRAQVMDWLVGRPACRINLPARGLLHGLAKCKGMLGLAVKPSHERFELLLVLPT